MNLKREQEFVSQYHFDARNFEWENENGAPETKVDVNFQLLQHDQENQVTSLVVILMDYNTTGDGQLSAVQLTKIMKETGKSLSQLASEVTIYPQKLVNIRVENAMKEKAMEVPAIKTIIEKMEEEMAGNGRILVRPSGTEPLLRVMAEAPTTEEVNYYVDTIAAVVKDEIGID